MEGQREELALAGLAQHWKNNPDFQCPKFSRKQFRLKNKCFLVCFWFMYYKMYCTGKKHILCAEKHTEDSWETSFSDTVSSSSFAFVFCFSFLFVFFFSSFSSIIWAKLQDEGTSVQILPTPSPQCVYISELLEFTATGWYELLHSLGFFLVLCISL